MKNKRLAIFLIIFVFFALVIVLSSAVFALESVTITYHSQTNILSGDEKVIIESGKFRYGENVFLSNKKQYIENIENANPYIRILNIETIFPNKFKIHAVEREQTYVFKTDNYYIVTDENMKVLDKQKSYVNSNQNPIEVFDAGFENVTVKTSDILTNDGYLHDLFHCFLEWKENHSEIKEKIKSIQVNYVDGLHSEEDNVLITMWDNVEILVCNSKTRMSDKLNFAFSAYDYLPEKTGRLEVIENNVGEIISIYKN